MSCMQRVRRFSSSLRPASAAARSTTRQDLSFVLHHFMGLNGFKG